MKPAIIGLIFLTAVAGAYAQVARPILPPNYSSSTMGTVTISGCISAGGIGIGPFVMMNPTVVPSRAAPGAASSSARPIAIPPVTITPMYLPPTTSPYEPSAVGTTGSGVVGSTGTTGVSADQGQIGYRLTGSDVSSWVGRRVQVTGNIVPPDPETLETLSAPDTIYYPEFDVQSVVPLTGVCPQQ